MDGRTVDDAPLCLAATNILAVDDDSLLGADDGKGDEVLCSVSLWIHGFVGNWCIP